MHQPEHARGFAQLEEALTVLFCLVDDIYQNINPNTRRYESLKKLSDSEVITLALSFSTCGAWRASAPSCVTLRGSSSPVWLASPLPPCPVSVSKSVLVMVIFS